MTVCKFGGSHSVNLKNKRLQHIGTPRLKHDAVNMHYLHATALIRTSDGKIDLKGQIFENMG